MTYKIITCRKKDYQQEAKALLEEARSFLKISLDDLIIYDMYEFDASTDEMELIKKEFFNQSDIEEYYDEIPKLEETSFRFSEVLGQYNEKEDMVEWMVSLLVPSVKVSHSRILELKGVSKKDFDTFKDYFINPVENKILNFDEKKKEMPVSSEKDLEELTGFIEMNNSQLVELTNQFSMDFDDLKFCQEYFKKEGRNPRAIELKVIDTYWSDHCRHTTFLTELTEVEIEEGLFENIFQQAIIEYFKTRNFVYEDREKPVSLMDIGTIETKELKKQGLLNDLDESDEINACSIKITISVDDHEEEWLLMFKNETHNHPTEIEPFGGASTCIGGCIRDPLSGRSYVYQGMRISGSKSPLTSYEETRANKLSSRQICLKAMEGFSDYANQIGVPSGYLKEYYHDGFEAKRLEAGALVAAAPVKNVVRKKPEAGDKIILLGAKTGKDGLGAAVGSSMVQTDDSLEEAGAEVQKGNPLVERKIIRLFRDEKVTRLIKKCNDFGAGGVSVAIGELADGIEVNLDLVPLKYPGLNGGEIAISESQERMAVVVSPEDVDLFLSYAKDEDVEATVVAHVTESERMIMFWQGKEIINISREFLDSNGAKKTAAAKILQPKGNYFAEEELKDLEKEVKKLLGKIENASQENLASNFDTTLNSSNVLYPFGGKYKKTPQLGMVSKIPLINGTTKDTSIMTASYFPNLSSWSPFHGGYYAVLDSIGKNVALGGSVDKIRLSVQEYFERLRESKERWGKPVASLLGAFMAMKSMKVPAIGGKDSMSGSFEEIDVPPTFISFAVSHSKSDQTVSREFKKVGSSLVYIDSMIDHYGLIDIEKWIKTLNRVEEALRRGDVLSISTSSIDGMIVDAFEMSFGNKIGFTIKEEFIASLFKKNLLSFLIETDHPEIFEDIGGQVIGTTSESIYLGNKEILLDEIQKIWLTPLEEVYSSNKTTDIISSPDTASKFINDYTKKNVLIPVLPGSNGEYDLQRAFIKRNAQVNEFVFKTETKEIFDKSCQEFSNVLENYDIIAFPNGALGGNEPDIAGKLLDLVLTRDSVKKSIHKYLENKGKILGIGSSFSSLIRVGLIEYGEIKSGTNIEILPNPMNKYESSLEKIVYTQDNLFGVTGFYTAPLSTKYGVLRVGELSKKQILSMFSQFYEGENGYDALSSPNGQVLGSLSSVERIEEGTLINTEMADHKNTIIDLLYMEV